MIKLSKDLIINTAFSEWGKTFFKNMSLTLISEKLKISKAALYKYFTNKDEIIQEMTNKLLGDMISYSNVMLENIQDSKTDFFEEYIKTVVDFFIDNSRYNYMLFYTIVAEKPTLFKHYTLNDIETKELDLLREYLSHVAPWINESQIRMSLFYTSTVIITMIFYKFYLPDIKKKKNITAKEKQDIIDSVLPLIRNGIGLKKCKIDFEKLENKFGFQDCDIIKKEKFIEGLSEIISEEGFWNVTIDKIAKRMGMAKSSIYIYFKNKNQMLLDFIINEREKFVDIFAGKISEKLGFFEMFYAFLYFTITFLNKDKQSLNIANWLHYQGVKMHDIERIRAQFDKMHSFLYEAFENGKLNAVNIDIKYFVFLINILQTKIILVSKYHELPIDNNVSRFIYKMILGGLNQGGLYE